MAADQRGKALPVHLEARQRDRRAGEHEAEDLPWPRRGREEVERLGADGQRQREAELPGAQVEFARRVIVGIGVAAGRRGGHDRRRGEADSPEQRRGLVDDRRVGVDAQAPLAEAEAQRTHAGQALERAADRGFLGGAVHRRHVQPARAGAGAGADVDAYRRRRRAAAVALRVFVGALRGLVVVMRHRSSDSGACNGARQAAFQTL